MAESSGHGSSEIGAFLSLSGLARMEVVDEVRGERALKKVAVPWWTGVCAGVDSSYLDGERREGVVVAGEEAASRADRRA